MLAEAALRRLEGQLPAAVAPAAAQQRQQQGQPPWSAQPGIAASRRQQEVEQAADEDVVDLTCSPPDPQAARLGSGMHATVGLQCPICGLVWAVGDLSNLDAHIDQCLAVLGST